MFGSKWICKFFTFFLGWILHDWTGDMPRTIHPIISIWITTKNLGNSSSVGPKAWFDFDYFFCWRHGNVNSEWEDPVHNNLLLIISVVTGKLGWAGMALLLIWISEHPLPPSSRWLPVPRDSRILPSAASSGFSHMCGDCRINGSIRDCCRSHR